LENSFFIITVYFYLFWASAIAAALEGAVSGFYLININKKINGTVTIAASTRKKLSTSSLVLLELIINPEIIRLNAKESRLANTHTKVINGNSSLRNQLKANLLAVFKRKILPTAAVSDPNRHKYGFPSLRNVLSQAPPTTSPPAIK
jgi:hypothetical protein